MSKYISITRHIRAIDNEIVVEKKSFQVKCWLCKSQWQEMKNSNLLLEIKEHEDNKENPYFYK